MAFWKALVALYRLVVVSRHNIDLLPINSTREGVRIRISSPESKSKIRISTKEKEIDTLTSTAVNTVSIFISNNNSSFAFGSLASTTPPPPSYHHDQHHPVSSFAFGSLANPLRRRWSLTIAIPLSRFARHIIGGGGCQHLFHSPTPPPHHRR